MPRIEFELSVRVYGDGETSGSVTGGGFTEILRVPPDLPEDLDWGETREVVARLLRCGVGLLGARREVIEEFIVRSAGMVTDVLLGMDGGNASGEAEEGLYRGRYLCTGGRRWWIPWNLESGNGAVAAQIGREVSQTPPPLPDLDRDYHPGDRLVEIELDAGAGEDGE